MPLRHVSIASILLGLAAACSAQSALIGEQDEDLGEETTSSADGSQITSNSSASSTSGAAGATTSDTSGGNGDGGTPSPKLGPCEDPTEIGLPPDMVAERLARLLFDAEPSEQLLGLARAGGLATYGQVECQALEMRQEPEHAAGLLAFLDAWLELSNWPFEPHTDLASELWPEMGAEASEFVKDFATSGDTSLAHLLTEPETTVGSGLAAHYGIEHAPQDEPLHLSVPGHLGLLSLGLITASRGRIGQRGYWVSQKLLCLDVGAPPVSQEIPIAEEANYREVYDSSVSAAACLGCHHLIDGPGHALERFDELGRAQETDGGKPVRTDGQLPASFVDATMQSFEDTSDFLEQLSRNPLVGSCLARYAIAFASNLELASVSDNSHDPALKSAVQRFEASDRDFSHLLVGLTQTEPFWQ